MAEDIADKGTFGDLCDDPTGNYLEQDDTNYETHRYKQLGSKVKYSGIKIESTNTSITNCSQITKVEICYEWWSDGSTQDCDISIDAGGGASFTKVISTCPGTTSIG